MIIKNVRERGESERRGKYEGMESKNKREKGRWRAPSHLVLL